FEIGIVRAIHVRDGQEVRKGEVLIELDPRMNESERAHLQADLIAARLDVARLKAALSGTDPVAAFQPPEDAAPYPIAMQRDSLCQHRTEYRLKSDALHRQRDQKQAERDTIQATIDKLSAVAPIVKERVDIRKASSEKEYTSRFQYLEMTQLLVEQQREL